MIQSFSADISYTAEFPALSRIPNSFAVKIAVNHFAIKRSNALLWSGELTRSEIQSRRDNGQIESDWLVCPAGLAKHAVPVDSFLEDPNLMQRLREDDEDRGAKLKQLIDSMDRPGLLRLGQALFRYGIYCLVFGGATVKIFFPEARGQGFPPGVLYILVPIWIMGGLGIIFSFIGWLQHRMNIYQMTRSSAKQGSPDNLV